MWDVFIQSPRGRLSLRKFIVLLATVLVAWLAYSLTSAPVASAIDAEIYKDTASGDQRIEYNGDTYSGPRERVATDGLTGIPVGSTYFFAKTDSDTKMHIIYFKKGVDYSKANDANHIVYDNKTKSNDGPFTNASSPVSLSISPRAPPATNVNEGYTACDVNGGLGWVICPLTNTLASAMDYIYGIVASFLRVQPLATTSDQAMYRAWSYMRTFANIAFIAAFLVIIYSQVTASGLGNYGIKKLLPRIIVAAVLVNVSYWICAIAVDISNILGYAVQDVFIMIRNSLVGSEGDNWNAVSWESMATFILSGGSVAAGAGIGISLGITALTASTVGVGAVGGVYLLLPILLSVLFVVLITLLVLAARQALIVILIVLAPLAFVAYLLPNTEKWFERWRSGLFTLLLVFPAFSVVFGGSQLAASIIIQSVLQKTEGGDPLDLTMIMLAMAVQVIPLAITPLLLKLGGGLLNRFAGVINNPTKGVFDRGKAWANERRDHAIAQGNRRIAGRVESGRLNPNRRFNAQAMAHRRSTDKMRREGEKAANEGLSKGYFAQSAEGRRVHNLSERAKMEQGLGDNENQANWNNLVRTSPGLRARSERSHTAHSTADLYKKSVEADEQEHWQNTLNTTPGLRNIQTQSSLAEGRANLTAEAIKNADDRTLQTQINATPGLRGLKIQADVDAAHAKDQAASVAATGKLTYQNELDNDRALKLMKVATYVTDQQAASIDTRLNKNSEARWNQLSRTDTNLQQLRLQETRDTDAARRVEEQYKSFIENIRAKGGDAPEVRQLNESLANSIKAIGYEVQYETSAQEAAKVEQQLSFGDELQNNQNALRKATGIGGDKARSRILARTRKTAFSPIVEGIKDIKDTIDILQSTNVDWLVDNIKDSSASLEQQVAWAGLLTQRGGPGHKGLRQVLAHMDATYGPESDETQTFKDLLSSTSDAMKTGKDIEFWLTNSRDESTGDLRTFIDLANDVGTWSAISARAFTNMNQVAQMKALRTLATGKPEQFNTLSELVLDDKQATAELKTFVVDALKHSPEDTAYWNSQEAAASSNASNTRLW